MFVLIIIMKPMVYIPSRSFRTEPRFTRGKMKGQGGSVLLQQGGSGGASSYDSLAEYVATTGRKVSGSGASLTKKLESLSFSTPKKPRAKNIKFNL